MMMMNGGAILIWLGLLIDRTGSYILRNHARTFSINKYSIELDRTYWRKSNTCHHAAVENTSPDFQQLEAVTSTNQSVLVIAGPGSGKTRVLSARLSYLLLNCICSPRDILVLSFTRSGALNLRYRADKLLEGTVASTSEVICETFHGFCGSVLKKYMPLISNKKEFTIAEDSQQFKIMSDMLTAKGIVASPSNVNSVLKQIRLWKELGLGYLGIRKKSLLTWAEIQGYDVYPEYQRKLQSLSYIDFGDLLLLTLKLFRAHPNVLNEYRDRFKHILVDEFQDVSTAQYDILRILSNGYNIFKMATPQELEERKKVLLIKNSNNLSDGNGDISGIIAVKKDPFPPLDFQPGLPEKVVNVFCAGDDDQSIYSWRGAQIQLMRRFRYDFPKAVVIRFETTYRLPESLCAATNTIAAGLSDRIPKTLQASSSVQDTFPLGSFEQESTPSIHVKMFLREDQEIKWIASNIKKTIADANNQLYDDQLSSVDVAVLTRTGADLKLVERGLKELGVQCSHRGRKAWSAPAGMENSLNILRLLAMPQDALAFEGALFSDLMLAALSTLEIKHGLLPIIRDHAEARSIARVDAARECILKNMLDTRHAKALTLFISRLDSWRAEIARYYVKGENGRRIIYTILQSAFGTQWTEAFSRDVEAVAKHVSTFDSLLQFFDENFIEQMDGDALPGTGKQQAEGRGVTVWLMTMPAAKGLEFSDVYLPQWVQGSVPMHDNDEERRLAFVSLTRAKANVHISYAQNKQDGASGKDILQQPSQYIAELVNSDSKLLSFRDMSLDSSAKTTTTVNKAVQKQAISEAEYMAASIEMSSEMLARNAFSISGSQQQRQINQIEALPRKDIRLKRVIQKREYASLPTAANVGLEDVRKLAKDSSFRKSDMKILFREVLALHGHKRGTIKLRNAGGEESKKFISSCSVSELASFLIDVFTQQQMK